MVPETERKSERPVVVQVAKEKMNVLQNMESTVTRDAERSLTSQPNVVLPKQSVPPSDTENPEINITDGVNPGGGDDADVTDDPSGSSSSFDDTFSAADGALTLSDGEIDSEFCGSSQQPSWAYPGYEEAFRMRKKKLTSHWRNFIRPVMWRCKWAELQMKKFQSQASMYSRILSEYDQGRQCQLENFSAESLCSRSLPFPHQIKRKTIMRRKKRKRVEDTVDITSYMLQHNLFGFCENKGTSTDNAHLINGYVNPVVLAVRNGGISLVDKDDLFQVGDEETSSERILAKIDSMQSRVHNLTFRVDKVVSENPGKFSSLNKLSLLAPCDSGASTAQYPTTPSSDKDKVLVASPSKTAHHASELQVEELIMPSSELHAEELIMPTTPVTAHQVADSPPNIGESADQPVVANKSDNAADEVPLRKRPLTEELIVYKRGMLSAKKRRMLSDKQPNNNSSISALKPRIGLSQAQNEKSSVFLASRYTSLLNNRKKRGKRTGARSGKKTSRGLNLAFRS
uniref:Uncharacterized protein n=1 Tax=Kalanchoe fedtschenkoi TaxID=63787 RepID=A0A7N0UPB6_KALFE